MRLSHVSSPVLKAFQDVDGKQRDTWGRTPIRVTDLAITPDFTKLVAVGMYDLPSPIPQSNAPSAEGVTPPAASGAAHANNSPPTEFRMIVYDLATKQLEAYVAVVLIGWCQGPNFTVLHIDPSGRRAS